MIEKYTGECEYFSIVNQMSSLLKYIDVIGQSVYLSCFSHLKGRMYSSYLIFSLRPASQSGSFWDRLSRTQTLHGSSCSLPSHVLIKKMYALKSVIKTQRRLRGRWIRKISSEKSRAALSVFEIDKWTSRSKQKYSGNAFIYGVYKNVQSLLLSFSPLK